MTTTYIHWLQEQHGQAELLQLLDAKEQQRAASFSFDQHRHLYIAAHVFLRKVLSYHAKLPPEDWRFYQNSFGKPYIRNQRFQSIKFNLSHTEGMIVCAINKADEVGVDVEGSRPLMYMEQMSRRNYSEREYDDIFSINNPRKQLQRFYTYWTLKESLVKALGCGLSMPLKNIGFIESKKGSWDLESSLEYPDENSNNNYLFDHKKMPSNHQVAVSVISVNKITKSANFYFIDSSHENSLHWQS